MKGESDIYVACTNDSDLTASQLPDEVLDEVGVIRRPEAWAQIPKARRSGAF